MMPTNYHKILNDLGTWSTEVNSNSLFLGTFAGH